MRFLVDAQLPRRLCTLLAEQGHEALHTLDLPSGNRTSDAEIARRADALGGIVVTKDRDFAHAHLIMGSPQRLLVIATGNITNTALLELLMGRLDDIEAAFGRANYVTLSRESLAIHDSPGATGEA